MSDEPHIDATQATWFKLDITNRVEPTISQTVHPFRDDFSLEMEATFEVDQETYQRYVGMAEEQRYTVEYSEDLNPWHRTVTGWARVRKLRDGLWWTFRRRILRRKLVESYKITVPNCRVTTQEQRPW